MLRKDIEIGKEYLITREFIEEDCRFVSFADGEKVKVVGYYCDYYVDCVGQNGTTQIVHPEDLVEIEVKPEDLTKLEPKDLIGKKCIVTRRFIKEDNRYVGFDEGELVTIVNLTYVGDSSESLIDCVNKEEVTQTLYEKDLVLLDESYYDYCSRVFGEDDILRHGCPDLYGFSSHCHYPCEECYKKAKYQLKPETKPEKGEVDLKPEFIPEVGDKVKVLNGTTIVNYRGGFIHDMKECIGRTGIVRLVDIEPNGRVGVYLEGIRFVFDARGLELIKKKVEVEEEPMEEGITEPEVFPVGTVGTIDFGDREVVFGINVDRFKGPLTIVEVTDHCSYLCDAQDGEQWFVPFEEFIPLKKPTLKEDTEGVKYLPNTTGLKKSFLLDVLNSNAGLQYGWVKDALQEVAKFVDKYMKDDE